VVSSICQEIRNKKIFLCSLHFIARLHDGRFCEKVADLYHGLAVCPCTISAKEAEVCSVEKLQEQFDTLDPEESQSEQPPVLSVCGLP
jgi:hypothetical protein